MPTSVNTHAPHIGYHAGASCRATGAQRRFLGQLRWTVNGGAPSKGALDRSTGDLAVPLKDPASQANDGDITICVLLPGVRTQRMVLRPDAAGCFFVRPVLQGRALALLVGCIC